jgi:hypothetical protein
VSISEPPTFPEKAQELEALQAVMRSWLELENQALSLKEQEIPLVFWPIQYETSVPLESRPGIRRGLSYTLYASGGSFPNICGATNRTLLSLEFYLAKLIEDSSADEELTQQLETMLAQVRKLKTACLKVMGDNN